MKMQMLLVGLMVSTAIAANPLPNKLEKSIEQELIPAFLDGQHAAILTMGTQVVQNVPDIQMEALDQKLAEAGVPPLGKLMLDSRFNLMTSNYKGRLPHPSSRELALMLPAFRKDIDRVIKEVKSADFMKSAPDRDFDQFEKAIWDAHVATNQMKLVADMVKYGHQVAHAKSSPTKGRRGKKESAEQAKLKADMASHFDELVVKIEGLQQAIDDREMELRIDQLDYAVAVLQTNSALKEKLKSAWVVESDGALLREFVNDRAKVAQAKSKRLKDRGLQNHVKLQIESGTQLAGSDLIKKSRLFFEGLHWWLRGRYGKGPIGGGFLKRTTAYNNPAEMFGLYMPKEKPTPTPPDNYTHQIPEVDRRHHYIWRFEYRNLYSGGFTRSKTNTQTNRKATSVTKLSRFY